MANEKRGICPKCAEMTRENGDSLCEKCNIIWERKCQQDERNGKVMLVDTEGYARIKGSETLARLERELVLAQDLYDEFFLQAQGSIRQFHIDAGAISIEKVQFNREVGKEFDVLIGTRGQAYKVFEARNGHGDKIASLRTFLEVSELTQEPETIKLSKRA